VQAEITALKAKREIVEHLLGLAEAARVPWLLQQHERFHLYQSFTTQELKDNLRQLTEEINNYLRIQSQSSSSSSVTPSPSKRVRSPHRDSTKQKNMRGKVMDRNRQFWYPEGNKPNHYKCDICEEETSKPSDYINSHIIAHAYCKRLKEDRLLNKRLPTSPSYVNNGLFLCRQCDKHFEDHFITIAGNGTVVVNDNATPRRTYQPLNGKLVKWSHLIDMDLDWPTSQTLDYRNTLVPVCGEHRKLEFGVDEDDASEGSISEDEIIETDKKRRKTGRKTKTGTK